MSVAQKLRDGKLWAVSGGDESVAGGRARLERELIAVVEAAESAAFYHTHAKGCLCGDCRLRAALDALDRKLGEGEA